MIYLKNVIEEELKLRDIKIVLIQGSARSLNNCSGENGKTKFLLDSVKKHLKTKKIKYDVIDLSIKESGNIIQPCKGCISTAGGFHCHFPCSCYSKNNKDVPDFISNEDVYSRLQNSDGFLVITPVSWDSVTTVVKSLFDRLVCVNLTLTVDEAKMLTDDDIKNVIKTKNLLKSRKYNHLLKNHLENKCAGFFIHGDKGASDYKEFSKNKKDGVEMPESMKNNDFKENETVLYDDIKQCIMPIVNQCIYSGIHVKKNCVDGMYINKGINYVEANENGAIDAKKRIIKVVDNLINVILKFKK